MMLPKTKAKSTLVNCRVNPTPSVSASISPLSIIVTLSTSSDPENQESNPTKQKHVGPSYIWSHGTQVPTLDPRNKHEYFLQKWDRKHIPGMRRKTESMFEEFKSSYDVAASGDIPNSPSDFDINLIDDFDISEWRFGGVRGWYQRRANYSGI